MVNQLLIAGHETTHVADHQLHVAAARGLPARWERVVADPALIPNAVEESLRFDPPVLGLCRTPNDDTTVDGVEIAAGCEGDGAVRLGQPRPSTASPTDPTSSSSTARCSRRASTTRSAGASTTASAPTSPGSTATVAIEELAARLPEPPPRRDTDPCASPFLWGRKALPVRWGVP